MIHAYRETYLNDAMNNLGEMFDYVVYDLKIEPQIFYLQFIVSDVSKGFASGNPKYVAGLSGVELASKVLISSGEYVEIVRPSEYLDRSPEYWAGWALAYYQWFTAYSFEYIYTHGVIFSKLISLYPTLHEADLSKLVKTIDKIIAKNLQGEISSLKKIRNAQNLTQRELAELSGVSLRMIQLYEQKQQDIRRAEVKSLVNISKVLGCEVEALFD